VSGSSWDELVEDTYRAPCGLQRLAYNNPFSLARQAGGLSSAFAYPAVFQGDPQNLSPTDNPSIEGGLYSSAEDYGRILLMHLRGGECDEGRVLSEATVARMRADRILAVYSGNSAAQAGRPAGGAVGAFEGYGLGWWIDRQRPGIFADPGLYGTFPWLDLPRGYGAIIALEADGMIGAQLWSSAKPALDRVFDVPR
jgi:CubicO group peptidase (beta-lactamase class C family)